MSYIYFTWKGRVLMKILVDNYNYGWLVEISTYPYSYHGKSTHMRAFSAYGSTRERIVARHLFTCSQVNIYIGIKVSTQTHTHTPLWYETSDHVI